MIHRMLDRLASITLRYPVSVLLAVAAITALLVLNTRHLQMRTDLSDMLGDGSPAAQALREYLREFGYGNRLFLVVEAPGAAELDAERMESVANRLVREMTDSGLFTYARAGLSDTELLGMAAFFVDHFPSFADPAKRQMLIDRVSPSGVRARVRTSSTGLLNPFSTMGPAYFALDPLGLAEFTTQSVGAAGDFAAFDLEWGSGGRFFSRDHRSLLIVAEPALPASDYDFAVKLMAWLRPRIDEAPGRDGEGDGSLRVTPVGAHAYAEQGRSLIQRDIRVASSVSVALNLLLCVAVYRWLPALLLTVLPTGLAILWTTGVISTYPGEINLISLGFIAIIVGLGDDQATYFFSRVPEEAAAGRSLSEAIRTTYVTTGKSVVFCILTTSTSTIALAMAGFKGLADLGMLLSVGLLMLLVHTLVTVPALMRLMWSAFPVRVSGEPFRILPGVALAAADLVTRFPRAVLIGGAALLLALGAAIPSIQVSDSLEGITRRDDPASAGQRLLATRFGLEGAPTVLIVRGNEEEVLEGTGRIRAALEPLVRRGEVHAVVAPADIVPSRATQHRRQEALAGLDFNAAAAALEQAVGETGLDPAAFQPAVGRLRRWASGAMPPVSLEAARRALPPGLLDTSVRKLADGRYLGAVTLYSSNPDATVSLSASDLAAVRAEAGPFVTFSYDSVGADIQARLVRDSRTAALWTTAGVVLIVSALFRKARVIALVLVPIVYGAVATVGALALAGHRFSGMAFAAFPLIVGIGIDNSIHLVRRHLDAPHSSPRQLLAASGAAIIQTNLTTMLGFGALMSATFQPLAELGMVTAVGMGFTLLATILLIPAIVARRSRPQSLPRSGL